jgi:hypothetical protein
VFAGRKTFHLGPDRGYDARHLVPQHLREMNAMIHCAMEDVQVSPADAAIRDTDLHL